LIIINVPYTALPLTILLTVTESGKQIQSCLSHHLSLLDCCSDCL